MHSFSNRSNKHVASHLYKFIHNVIIILLDSYLNFFISDCVCSPVLLCFVSFVDFAHFSFHFHCYLLIYCYKTNKYSLRNVESTSVPQLMVNEYCDKYCDDILTHVDQPCAAPFQSHPRRERYTVTQLPELYLRSRDKGCLARVVLCGKTAPVRIKIITTKCHKCL